MKKLKNIADTSSINVESQMPLVSVIIATYRRPENLNNAINSVLNQTYPNIELIVVDDNDNNSEYRVSTEKIIDKFSENTKLKYIKHKKNSNGAVARN